MNNLTSYHPNSCTDSLSYLKQCCPRTENGGIRNIILVDKYYQSTLLSELDAAADDTQAQFAAWNKANLANKLIVLPNVLGEYDGGSPRENQGYGGAQSRVTGMEHTAKIDDINVVGNRGFADAVSQAQQYILWFATEYLIWNTHAPCGISATMPVEREYISEVKYVYTIKWSTTLHPQHYWLPVTLFDCTAFSAAIAFDNVSGSPVSVAFDATYETIATAAGLITLTVVNYNDGATDSDVTTDYTDPAHAIASSTSNTSFTVSGPASQAAGTYTYTFEISGAGLTVNQTIEVIQIVL